MIQKQTQNEPWHQALAPVLGQAWVPALVMALARPTQFCSTKISISAASPLWCRWQTPKPSSSRSPLPILSNWKSPMRRKGNSQPKLLRPPSTGPSIKSQVKLQLLPGSPQVSSSLTAPPSLPAYSPMPRCPRLTFHTPPFVYGLMPSSISSPTTMG